MRRIPAVFMAAFVLIVVLGLVGWQTQQNFGTGLPVGLFFSPPTFTVSTVGGGNGTLALAGNTSGTATLAAPAVAGTATNPLLISNSLQFPSGTAVNWNNDTGLSRDAAGVIDVGNGTAGNATGTIKSAVYQTATNCASSGGTCGSAASGSVSIAAAASTVTVATTAVTANSVIILTRDDTLGTKLTVTCNTATAAGDIKPSTRTANTSFVITVQNAPAVNPLCLNYWIIN